jgi:cytochrome c556
MKRFVLTATAIACAVAAAAQTRQLDAAGTIRMRQANYKQMAAAMKAIRDQLRASRPSVSAIRRGSALVTGHAVNVLRWFPRGTGPEAGVRTRALPQIWAEHAAFTRRGAVLLAAARRLDAAARRGDIAQVRAALPAVAGACGACHDDFRAPE